MYNKQNRSGQTTDPLINILQFNRDRRFHMKKTLHIIPHSHWDREWYQSFEAHRIKLVELFDAIIDSAIFIPSIQVITANAIGREVRKSKSNMLERYSPPPIKIPTKKQTNIVDVARYLLGFILSPQMFFSQ